MTSLPIGLLIIALVVAFSLNGVDLSLFLNGHSISLVLGGTLAILLASTPWNALAAVGRCLAGLFKNQNPRALIDGTLIRFSKGDRSVAADAHPLLQRAKDLWEQGVDPELFETLLHQSLDEANQSLEEAVVAVRNLSKYPPALGMTGTVMGLVTMFSRLGPGQDGKLGASLALAMTATFYGLIVANALVLPLSDRMSVVQVSTTRLNDYVFRALILIHRGEATSVIEDKAHAYAA